MSLLKRVWGGCDEVERQLLVVIAALVVFRIYLAVMW